MGEALPLLQDRGAGGRCFCAQLESPKHLLEEGQACWVDLGLEEIQSRN